ncbi:MAG: PAS domain-containing protein [Spirulinaceae cyanobacterium RM2_2_10]|nr:PAS domain-containing protein [Spirulinaceae cyanobacterium RM2_2_10]
MAILGSLLLAALLLITTSDLASSPILERWLEPAVELGWQEIRHFLIDTAIYLPLFGCVGFVIWNRILRHEVARRQLVEARLQSCESRLRLALEASAMVCWEYDVATEQIHGFGLHTAQGWQSLTWQASTAQMQARIHPDDRAMVWRAAEAAMNSATDLRLEHRVLLAEQQTLWVQVLGRTLTDASGQLSRLVGIALNISDRKQTETQLRESQQRYTKLVATLPVGVFRHDAAGRCLYINERCTQISGLTLAAIANHGWAEAVHPDDRDRVVTAWEQFLQAQIPFHCEYRFRHPDGRVRWVDTQSVVERDNTGQVIGYVGTIADVTSRKLAAATIRQESTFRQQILEHMAEGLCVCHAIEHFPFVRFTVWNPQVEAITGYTLAEINRLGWYQSLYPDPDIREKAIGRMARMRQGDNLVAEEWDIQCRDGQQRTIALSTSLLASDDGQPHVLALIQDITVRKQTERQLTTSENQFRSIFDRAAVGIVYSPLQDQRNKLLACNPHFAKCWVTPPRN